MLLSDVVLDRIVDASLVSCGFPTEMIKANGGRVCGAVGKVSKGKMPGWTPEEDDFARRSIGIHSEAEVAAMLGRTENGVRVRSKRKGFTPPSRMNGCISANKASLMLGVDIHALKGWIVRGIFPAQPANTPLRKIYLVNLEEMKYWITRPNHWPYFKVKKMKPGYLRRLVEKAQARWGDEWLTMRQMADMHGISDVGVVNVQFERGRLPGLQVYHIGGRNKGGWAYWFVRRSVAESWVRPRYTDPKSKWITPAADAFMLRMDAEGLTAPAIGRMMKQNARTVDYRIRLLKGGK